MVDAVEHRKPLLHFNIDEVPVPNEHIPPIDSTFYTTLRYPVDARDIIKGFATAQRDLLTRLKEDLLEGRRGRFGSDKYETMRPALARGIDRLFGHVDAFELILLNAPGPAGDTVRNVVANVVSDANFEDVAQTHRKAPKAKEGKFDVDFSGFVTGLGGDIADKLWQIVDILPQGIPGAGLLLNIIALILRDLGIYGKTAEGPATNEIAQQVEDKLDFVTKGVESLAQGQDGLAQGQGGLDQGQRRISLIVDIVKSLLESVQREVDKIEQKTDTLADLLGKTLVSSPWVVDPTKTAVANKTPQKGVKEELHEIEDILNYIVKVLPPLIKDGPEPPPPPPDGGPVPKHDEPLVIQNPPVLLDVRLKKIFVYAENIFAPKTKTERRTIRVRTGAFDLTGWLDLTDLRKGDRVEVQIQVSLAGKKNVPFVKTQFDTPGLKSFSEFAKGLNCISGDDIRIIIRQPQSSTSFRKRLRIAYQFVVESQ